VFNGDWLIMLYLIPEALHALRPNANWDTTGFEYSGINWTDEVQTKPTKEEVDAKVAEIAAAWPMKLLREERDRLIAETDWWAGADLPISDERKNYRKALRDLPSTAEPVLDDSKQCGISNVTWPTKPS